jgi:hypothetical protein
MSCGIMLVLVFCHGGRLDLWMMGICSVSCFLVFLIEFQFFVWFVYFVVNFLRVSTPPR